MMTKGSGYINISPLDDIFAEFVVQNLRANWQYHAQPTLTFYLFIYIVYYRRIGRFVFLAKPTCTLSHKAKLRKHYIHQYYITRMNALLCVKCNNRNVYQNLYSLPHIHICCLVITHPPWMPSKPIVICQCPTTTTITIITTSPYR